MRNYDWGFAPNPLARYWSTMWPVDREATYGFAGGGGMEGDSQGGAQRPGGYDRGYAARGYDAPVRGPGSQMQHGRWQEARVVRPWHDEDRVVYRDRPGYDRGFRGRGPVGGGYTDRGVYGESYPGYGGYPGAASRGMYSGWDGGRGGYDRGFGGGTGQGYAHEPFIPEEAYRRHPELQARPHHYDVEYGAPDDVGGVMDDGEIFQAVRARLLQDRYLDAERITVMVSDGVVTLDGEVDDFMEARYAWDDAWESPGVRGVVNRLAVRTDQAHVSHNDELPQSSGGSR